MPSQIQLRRDTAANWTANNPILAQGEYGLETDNLGTNNVQYKIGDGVTNWASLPFKLVVVLVLVTWIQLFTTLKELQQMRF